MAVVSPHHARSSGMPQVDPTPSASSLAHPSTPEPAVAVVHEWMTSYAGSERVVEQLLKCYERAELYAVCDFLEAHEREFLQGRHVNTTFIQNVPFARRTFRHLLPLLTLA